jgi:hypothetical protein
MTVTLNQLEEAQRKADTCQAVTEALRDSTKVLSDNTIRDLLHFSEVNARSYAVDQTVFHHVRSQHHENGRLKEQVVKIWNRQLSLQQELTDIREYCGFDTAQALKEAVEAGKTAPVPVPVPVAPVAPAHHVTVTNPLFKPAPINAPSTPAPAPATLDESVVTPSTLNESNVGHRRHIQ